VTDDPTRVPDGLKHKPVIVVNNYSEIDGRYSSDTDAKGLSLGIAQWGDRKRYPDISAKVWRYTGEKWSRQSEELPLHRVLDLAILICRSKQFFAERYLKSTEEHLKEETFDTIPLQGAAMRIGLCGSNNHIKDDLEIFDTQLRRDDELLSERLRRLGGILKELGY
jgi:hypothetical protein